MLESIDPTLAGYGLVISIFLMAVGLLLAVVSIIFDYLDRRRHRAFLLEQQQCFSEQTQMQTQTWEELMEVVEAARQRDNNL